MNNYIIITKNKKLLPMRIELIISSLQDWCLTTMALEAIGEHTIALKICHPQKYTYVLKIGHPQNMSA